MMTLHYQLVDSKNIRKNSKCTYSKCTVKKNKILKKDDKSSDYNFTVQKNCTVDVRNGTKICTVRPVNYPNFFLFLYGTNGIRTNRMLPHIF